MNRIFSRHVKSLADGTGAEDVHLFDAAWEKLGDALQSEMRKRGIWLAPPSYLGLVGYVSWSQDEAFFELQSDCYSFSFVERLPGLSALLDHQDNIEGVVFVNIRRFLFELQSEYDPVGYRVFCRTRTATDQLVEEGMLCSSISPGRVTNDSILWFPTGSETQPVPREVLAAVVEPWGPDLLPDLIRGRGREREVVTAALGRLILSLEAEGIDCFRFRDLAQILKGSVRRSWSATWHHSEREWGFDDGDEDESFLVPWVAPDGEFEMWEQFRYLERCVKEGIVRLQVRPKMRRDLGRLWICLCQLAAESAGESKRRSRAPSQRFLAEHLGISRVRISTLLDTLGKLLQDCSGTVH